MIEAYLKHKEERAALGIPPLPLSQEQTEELCRLLLDPPEGREDFLLDLLTDRVPPGVDPAARVKADFLAEIALGKIGCDPVSRKESVRLLGTMVGGYNLHPLVSLLADGQLGAEAASTLSGIILAADVFDEVLELGKSNPHARRVVEEWAEGEWFREKPHLPTEIEGVVYKVNGEVNTDDLSPAPEAWSRPDIPLHAKSMGKNRFPDGVETIARLRKENLRVIFAADVVGTGSSRKSACNSLLWHIGDDIPHIPNKRRGGVILGGQIAPIFFNTAEDSGALPIRCDVGGFETGMRIVIKTDASLIADRSGNTITTFSLADSLIEEVRAGGRVPLIIGRSLTERARKALGRGKSSLFAEEVRPNRPKGGYTLAKKIIGNACGMEGMPPGTFCTPKMTTVGSQDTTGPMTRDEMAELACLSFQADFVMQSFCHTVAYPKPEDIRTHETLPDFFTGRKGVSLKPGDGIIHTWLNRFLIPDKVGTGADSHTRFPLGISFAAGSGLVAFAASLGNMPLEMPESVLVRFDGNLRTGITLRDVVNAIPYFAIQKGLLTVEKRNKRNAFSGRILEMEGLPNLAVEQAFELTDASAERSAAAAAIQLHEETVSTYLHSNVALMRKMIREGYRDAQTLQNRIDGMEAWLKRPKLLRADPEAEYAETLDIDLTEIDEPILACPNDPDNVKKLSEVQGNPVDEVFVGSCMTNIGHFRALAEILKGAGSAKTKLWVCPPSRMDREQLEREGVYTVLEAADARMEIPGCSLCMGNQARVADNSVVFSTSTRNFNNRMGAGAQVYLGSAELAALVALTGRLPTVEEYFGVYREKIAPRFETIYRYLDFSRMEE